MNSGILGALGTAPLQTVKSRLGRFKGQSYTKLAENSRIIIGNTPNESSANNITISPVNISFINVTTGVNVDLINFSFPALSRSAKFYWWTNYGLVIQATSADILFTHSGGTTVLGGQLYPLIGNLDLGQSSGSSRYISNIYSKAPHQFLQQSTPSNPLTDCAQIYAKNINGTAEMHTMDGAGNEYSVGNSVGLTNTSTGTTPTELFLNGTSTRLSINTSTVVSGIATITGVKSDGSAVCMFARKFCIKRVGSTTSIVGTVETIGSDIKDVPTPDVTLTADDTNDALAITVTGVTAETWKWKCIISGLNRHAF